MYEQNVIDALAMLRNFRHGSSTDSEVAGAINTLDDAGVFAAIDEQAQTGQAEEILQGGRALDLKGFMAPPKERPLPYTPYPPDPDTDTY